MSTIAEAAEDFSDSSVLGDESLGATCKALDESLGATFKTMRRSRSMEYDDPVPAPTSGLHPSFSYFFGKQSQPPQHTTTSPRKYAKKTNTALQRSRSVSYAPCNDSSGFSSTLYQMIRSRTATITSIESASGNDDIDEISTNSNNSNDNNPNSRIASFHNSNNNNKHLDSVDITASDNPNSRITSFHKNNKHFDSIDVLDEYSEFEEDMTLFEQEMTQRGEGDNSRGDLLRNCSRNNSDDLDQMCYGNHDIMDDDELDNDNDNVDNVDNVSRTQSYGSDSGHSGLSWGSCFWDVGEKRRSTKQKQMQQLQLLGKKYNHDELSHIFKHISTEEAFAGIVNKKFKKIKQAMKTNGFVTDLALLQISRGVVAAEMIHEIEKGELRRTFTN